MTSVRDEVARLMARGWSPVPIPARSKAPVIKGWQTLDFRVAPSMATLASGLANVAEASSISTSTAERRASPLRSVPITARSGRPSNPLSHYW